LKTVTVETAQLRLLGGFAPCRLATRYALRPGRYAAVPPGIPPALRARKAPLRGDHQTSSRQTPANGLTARQSKNKTVWRENAKAKSENRLCKCRHWLWEPAGAARTQYPAMGSIVRCRESLSGAMATVTGSYSAYCRELFITISAGGVGWSPAAHPSGWCTPATGFHAAWPRGGASEYLPSRCPPCCGPSAGWPCPAW
jgi:hypothetical protein